MITEIIQKYKAFGDAIINHVEYYPMNYGEKGDGKELIVLITCLNWQTEKWEKIKLVFKDVILFRYIETTKMQSSLIFEALVAQHSDNIVIDFFPIQVDGLGKLEEDPNSTFLVHSKEISYEVIL